MIAATNGGDRVERIDPMTDESDDESSHSGGSCHAREHLCQSWLLNHLSLLMIL
jgi:hypothetical protein